MPTSTLAAEPGDYLNTAEVSERFFGKLSTQTIRHYVAHEGLPAHRVMRRLYFDPVEVEAWIRARSTRVADDDTARPATDDHRAAIKRLVDAAPTLTAAQAERIRALLSGGAA